MFPFGNGIMYPSTFGRDSPIDPRFQHSCILELRKEKSRDAARSRRGKENYEFYELAKLLPLPCAITSQLDKASIIRLAISYLKLRDFSSHGDPPWNRDGPPPNKSVQAGPNRRRSVAAVAAEIFEPHQGTHILQSLDGFAFAVSTDGRFLYISETVSIYLGLSQVEMTGSSVFEYIHPEDHAELAEKLGLCLPQQSPSGGSSGSGDDNNSTSPGSVHIPGPPAPERAFMNTAGKGHVLDRSFCIRMKSTLTKRGVHVKSSGYRVVLILTQVRAQFSFSLSRKHPPPILGLVNVAIALPPPTIHEVLIDNECFVTRLSPELKVLYCEQRISDLMDLSAEDLTNSSLYSHCHAADLQKLKKAHTDLNTKGQVLSDYYRLMNKHGGYVWLQTCATIICHAKNADEQNIIAINYVISGIEYGGCVMNTEQMKHVSRTEPDQSDHSESDTASEPGDRRGSKSPGSLGSPNNSNLKRKHSPSLEDNGYDSMALQDHKLHCKDDTYDSYGDDFNCKPGEKRDLKNSRRKMDKPRKRSRLDSGSDPEMNIGHCQSENDTGREAEELDGIMDEEDRHDVQPPNAVDLTSVPIHSNPPQALSLVKSPAPEDLSVRTSQSTILQSPGSHISNGSNEKWPTSVGTDNPVTNSTVRDLEEIMNKHLPAMPSGADTRQTYPADYDSSLNSATINFPQKHRSTIQWIGSQHPPHEHLPASTLLRTLYANRESVIRSNVYKCSQSYSEGGVQNNLLTPPGSDHSQVATTKSPPVSASYVPVPISVSMATNQNETYSMTPPSSVSPHEKYQISYPDQNYQESAMRQCGADLGASHGMPIKPQAYPLPAHTNSHLAMYGRAGVPYGATDYYSSSTPFSGYPALGSSHATYTDAQKNATTW